MSVPGNYGPLGFLFSARGFAVRFLKCHMSEELQVWLGDSTRVAVVRTLVQAIKTGA